MLNQFTNLSSFYKITMTTCSPKHSVKHAMHHLLPSPKSTCYNLQSLGHGLSVGLVKSELHKKTFINRVYLVSAIDIFVVLSCILVLILCFLSSA